MIARLCSFLVRHLEQRRITREDDPEDVYLTRYYLLGSGRKHGSLFLHHIHRSDSTTELHNHPFGAVSFILKGGYWEDRLAEDGHTVTRRFVRPFTFNRIKANTFHRIDIEAKTGAWTLFIRGRRTQTWGFYELATGRFRQWDAVSL